MQNTQSKETVDSFVEERLVGLIAVCGDLPWIRIAAHANSKPSHSDSLDRRELCPKRPRSLGEEVSVIVPQPRHIPYRLQSLYHSLLFVNGKRNLDMVNYPFQREVLIENIWALIHRCMRWGRSRRSARTPPKIMCGL